MKETENTLEGIGDPILNRKLGENFTRVQKNREECELDRIGEPIYGDFRSIALRRSKGKRRRHVDMKIREM